MRLDDDADDAGTGADCGEGDEEGDHCSYRRDQSTSGAGCSPTVRRSCATARSSSAKPSSPVADVLM